MAVADQTQHRADIHGTGAQLAERPRVRAVTWRSVLAALVLLPLNAYWVVQMEVVRYSAHPTTISLFFNIVFILLVLTLANRLVASRAPRLALNRAELLFIYAVLAIGSCVCGHDMFQVLVPMLTWPYRYADASNQWQSLFIDKHLPGYPFTLGDQDVIAGYYIGNDTFYRWKYISAWLPVALTWSGFTAVLMFVMLCMNAILRRQWTENERLSYPIVQLPLQITNEQSFSAGGLFRNRLFWMGCALAAFIDITNSLNVYYPSVPTIFTPGRGQSFWNVNEWVTQKPWYAIGWTPVSFYPFLIGLGMLMPMDFLFSCWFFYLFWKMQLVVSVAMAWDQDPRFPYQNNQAFGAYMSFCALSVALSRGYLREVLRRALGRPSTLDDTKEPVTYRTALAGILAGFGVACWFSWRIGLGVWLPIVFFLIYFALALAITRMRAEMGTPVHDLHFTGPDQILTETLGQRAAFTPGQLTIMSMYWWFNRAYRSHPMPHQLEAFKLAEQSQSEYRRWFWALAIFGLLAGLAAFWAMLHLMYEYGARAKSTMTFGPEAYTQLDGWLKTPKLGNFRAGMAIAVGFLSASFLQFMRVRFTWWPFHPLAYAVTSAWEMNLVWMPLFLAWLCKSVILRYGGRLGFQRSIPFFIGLMLGQFVVGSLLNIYGIIMQVPTYQFWQ